MILPYRVNAFVVAKLALSVIPLVALTAVAVPAKATLGVIFGTGPCVVSEGTGSCSDTANPGGANAAANWINLTSTTISSAQEGGVNAECFNAGFLGQGSPGCGGFTEDVQFSLSGGGSGTFDVAQNIPVTLDFLIVAASQVNWNVIIDITTASNGTFYTSTDPLTGSVGSGSTHVTTYGVIPNVLGTVTGYSISLAADDPNGDAFTLAAPIFLNQTPEPSSLLLIGAGVIALFLRKKRQ